MMRGRKCDRPHNAAINAEWRAQRGGWLYQQGQLAIRLRGANFCGVQSNAPTAKIMLAQLGPAEAL